jgi:hypothetical protein
MTNPISPALVTLAARVIEGEVHLDLSPGSDYQGDLVLTWDGSGFHAVLDIYSDPHTSYGSYYDPPETTWREQQDQFEAVKIKAVAEWIKAEWGFDLV